MNKILLVQPIAFSKFPGMPMGMLYTAASLQHDYDVVAYDVNATPFDHVGFQDILEAAHPDVVMIGGTSPSQPDAYQMARTVKEWRESTLVIKGGPHEQFYPEQSARNEYIDFVLSGDGECAPDLLRKIAAHQQVDKVFRGHVLDLSECPLPDRQLLYPRNPKYYDFLGAPTAQTRFDRGCHFHCSYCSQGLHRSYDDGYVHRDLERIKEEGFEAVYWDNAVFTADRDRVLRLMEFVRPFRFRMSGITRAGVNTDSEIFEAMRKSGFEELWVSLESGSKKILKQLGRESAGPEKVRSAVENARGVGLRPYVNIIIGCPGETDESIEDTINALVAIHPHAVSASVYTIYPGMSGCDEWTYERPRNRDARLMKFDEGYGGKTVVEAGAAEEWYFRIHDRLIGEGVRMLDCSDCRTPEYWCAEAE